MDEGFLWFSLKDPAVLPMTMLWMENHGRHFPPWNGRNCCLGLEDLCGYFAGGYAPSVRAKAAEVEALLVGQPLEVGHQSPADVVGDGRTHAARDAAVEQRHRRAQDLDRLRRHPEAAGQRPVVELQDEVAAPLVARCGRTGDVVAAMRVGGRDEAKSRAVVTSIRNSTGNAKVDYVLGDLSSIEQTLRTPLPMYFSASFCFPGWARSMTAALREEDSFLRRPMRKSSSDIV